MTGDEKTNDESKQPDDDSKPLAPAPKAVFSDDFDDPENKRDQDELPEDEPLTPELVEEEAIRGDFMLRWAAVFLAVLMAFGQLNDTKPLVLIRSGDQMRASGFLPSRVDQLSITTEGKSVTNVSWLFDHLVSLSWMVAGEKGLTLLKVFVAGLSAFFLVRISIPGVSTWWSSICTVFAVVACSSDFMPLPELITILGMTLTMRFLFQHRMGKGVGLNWKLPLLLAVQPDNGRPALLSLTQSIAETAWVSRLAPLTAQRRLQAREWLHEGFWILYYRGSTAIYLASARHEREAGYW